MTDLIFVRVQMLSFEQRKSTKFCLNRGGVLGISNVNSTESNCAVVPGHGDLDIYIVGFHRRVKVPSVRSILYSTTSLGSWDLPYMGDSIWD